MLEQNSPEKSGWTHPSGRARAKDEKKGGEEKRTGVDLGSGKGLRRDPVMQLVTFQEGEPWGALQVKFSQDPHFL